MCPKLLPIGPKVVPFWGSYLEFYKVIPKKELLWGLWVEPLNPSTVIEPLEEPSKEALQGTRIPRDSKTS